MSLWEQRSTYWRYIFSSSHVRVVNRYKSWTIKKGWGPKNWCFQAVVLEKTHESPLDCKEIKPVNPKGNQPWIFTGRTDAEAEAPILWPPDAKSWLTGKRPWWWERMRAKGEGGDREWDGWMASPTQQTWLWANSGKEWRTGKPCVLQPMGSQKSQTQLSDWTTSFLIPRPCGQWDWPSLDPGSLL